MNHDDEYLADFQAESNLIEGIEITTEAEVNATRAFVTQHAITIYDLQALVQVYQPDAVLRDRRGLDVRVGAHIPPRGGAHIVDQLDALIRDAEAQRLPPYEIHVQYETLHPFTDGNGRSGRALWLRQMYWDMEDFPQLTFLHLWYYQSLDHSR